MSSEQIESIIRYVENLNKKRILVEDIQDIIEQKLMEYGKYDLAKIYIIYRYNRMLVRKSNTTDESILSIIKNSDHDLIKEKFNKEQFYVYEQRDLIASEVSKDLTRRVLFPDEVTNGVDTGSIYFHQLGYFIQPIIDSSIINTEYLLEHDFRIHGFLVRKPKNMYDACFNLARAMFYMSSSQSGEVTIELKYLDRFIESDNSSAIELMLDLIYSYVNVNGNIPIVNLILEVENYKLFNFYKEFISKYVTYDKVKNSPRIIYVLDANTSDSKHRYFELTRMIVNCSEKKYPVRYFSSKKTKTYYQSKDIRPVNFDTMLIPYKNKDGIYQTNGRFSQGTVTLNLNQIGLIANNDEEFFNLLDERLELAKEALMCKYFNLSGTSCDSNLLAFKDGALVVSKEEKIDFYLKGNYSILVLGIAGLYNVLENYKKVSFNSEDGFKFITMILSNINKKIETWRKETMIGFTLSMVDSYSSNYLFYKKDKELYNNRSNLNYINLPMVESIEELRLEGIIQDMIKGNCVIDVDMNVLDIEDLINFIYENIGYVSLKTSKIEEE